MRISINLFDDACGYYDNKVFEVDSGIDRDYIVEILEKANKLLNIAIDLDYCDDNELPIDLTSEQKDYIKGLRDDGYTIDTMLDIAEYLFDIEFYNASADLIFDMEL